MGGIGAPKNTPMEIIERLNREINTGLASNCSDHGRRVVEARFRIQADPTRTSLKGSG